MCSSQGKPGKPKEHLSVFVGLSSHANFPHPTNGTVYGALRNDQRHSPACSRVSDGNCRGTDGDVEPMEGMLLLDRSARGGPSWYPTDKNVVQLEGVQQISDQAEEGGKAGGRRKGTGGQQTGRGLSSKGEGMSGVSEGESRGDVGGTAVGTGDQAWARYSGFWWVWFKAEWFACQSPRAHKFPLLVKPRQKKVSSEAASGSCQSCVRAMRYQKTGICCT